MAASSEEIPGIGLPLLPTTVIGSYAYPSWLWTALEEMRQGKYGETDIAETLGDAVRMAILDQEESGIDIINDGEMRRWYVFQSWYKRLSGLEALEPLRKVGFYAHDSSLRYRPTAPFVICRVFRQTCAERTLSVLTMMPATGCWRCLAPPPPDSRGSLGSSPRCDAKKDPPVTGKRRGALVCFEHCRS